MRRRRRGKYGAIKTGKYASRFEAKVAGDLRAALAPGETLGEQIPIRFACGAKYICDFVIADANGEIVRYVEAKGFATTVWKLKLRLLRYEHPDIASKLTIIEPPKRKKRSQ